MKVHTFDDRMSLALSAAQDSAAFIREAIAQHNSARIVVATAASQLEFLDALGASHDIDWQKVEVFHLDEYVGLPITHRGSFRRILLDGFIAKTGVVNYHLLQGDAADVYEAARTVGEQLQWRPVDIAFLGIGENSHLAFNDPPADFAVETPYIIVELDDICRRQQVAEGWFATFEEVPKRAISMSIRQILKARKILALVPGSRKAVAVRDCMAGPIDPGVPGSALRMHRDVTLYLDKDSAALLHRDVPASMHTRP